MDRNVKIVLIAAVVVLVVASAVFFLYPRDSEEPTVLEVKIIGFDSFGNFALDVTRNSFMVWERTSVTKCIWTYVESAS